VVRLILLPTHALNRPSICCLGKAHHVPPRDFSASVDPDFFALPAEEANAMGRGLARQCRVASASLWCRPRAPGVMEVSRALFCAGAMTL
jgi:hypothetical protein